MQEKINEILRKIDAVKREYGIDEQITIVGATKTVPAETINKLPSLGITIAGENRVQELLEKYDAVSGIEWHLIGALQTNKVKYIIDKVKLIHSVDRESLADEIDRQAKKHGLVMPVLVEINVGREENKSGVMPEKALELLEYVNGKANLALKGVMTVFPIDAPDDVYEQFSAFANLAKQKYGTTIVSAGMSGDYEKAIRYGANLVRLGSVIFGKRIYNQGEQNGKI